MERPELKLVTDEPGRVARPVAACLGAAILAAALLATLCGADAARRPFDPATIAQSALASTIASGDPLPAREALVTLSERLRGNPLDGASRTIAASLMTETASTPSEGAAAVEQALSAIRLSPTNEHVARGAARVLARCGRIDLALAEIARIFDHAPAVAAATLADVEPFVPAERLEAGLPESPESWLAWSVRLRIQGREADADLRLAALLARWPDDLPALLAAASTAASRDRVDELVRLVPPTRELPGTAEAARLHAYRARTRALAGDPAGARADAERAVLLSNDEPWVMALAGDALSETQPDAARDYWTRALHRLLAKPQTRGEAIWLRHRLARLDLRTGRAGDALREWRTILAARPDDAEAKRRVQELTGASAP